MLQTHPPRAARKRYRPSAKAVTSPPHYRSVGTRRNRRAYRAGLLPLILAASHAVLTRDGRGTPSRSFKPRRVGRSSAGHREKHRRSHQGFTALTTSGHVLDPAASRCRRKVIGEDGQSGSGGAPAIAQHRASSPGQTEVPTKRAEPKCGPSCRSPPGCLDCDPVDGVKEGRRPSVSDLRCSQYTPARRTLRHPSRETADEERRGDRAARSP